MRAWSYVQCRTPGTSATPWCKAARRVLEAWDPRGRSLGCFARRPVAGGGGYWSVHACGRAIDWAPSTREAGWRLWFRLIDSRSPDLQLVLWDGFQWGGRAGPFVVAFGGDPHRDHLHIESRNDWPVAGS